MYSTVPCTAYSTIQYSTEYQGTERLFNLVSIPGFGLPTFSYYRCLNFTTCLNNDPVIHSLRRRTANRTTIFYCTYDAVTYLAPRSLPIPACPGAGRRDCVALMMIDDACKLQTQ